MPARWILGHEIQPQSIPLDRVKGLLTPDNYGSVPTKPTAPPGVGVSDTEPDPVLNTDLIASLSILDAHIYDLAADKLTAGVIGITDTLYLESGNAKITLNDDGLRIEKVDDSDVYIELNPNAADYIGKFAGGALYAERVDSDDNSHLSIADGRLSTHSVVVASPDTSAQGKAAADYVIPSGEDASTYIQDALDELEDSGGMCVLLEGDFWCQTPITVPAQVLILGVGGFATTVYRGVVAGFDSSSGDPLFSLYHDSAWSNGVVFRDLHLTEYDTTDSGILIDGGDANNATFERLEIACDSGGGIYLDDGGYGHLVDGCSVWGNSGWAVYIASDASTSITPSRITGNRFSLPVQCAQPHTVIEENIFEDTYLLLAHEGTNNETSIVVKDNVFDGVETGHDCVEIEASVTGTVVMSNIFLDASGNEVDDSGTSSVIKFNSHQ